MAVIMSREIVPTVAKKTCTLIGSNGGQTGSGVRSTVTINDVVYYEAKPNSGQAIRIEKGTVIHLQVMSDTTPNSSAYIRIYDKNGNRIYFVYVSDGPIEYDYTVTTTVTVTIGYTIDSHTLESYGDITIEET